MKLFLKFTINTLASFVLFIVVLPLIISLLLQYNFIQNFAIKQFATFASNKLGTKVEISHIDLKLFYNAVIEGFYVEDPLEGDTLLYVGRLEAQIKNTSLFGGRLAFGRVKLDQGQLAINTDSLNMANIKHVVDKLKPKVKKKNRTFEMSIDEIDIDSFCFEYRKFRPRDDVSYGVNLEDMGFNNMSLNASDFFIHVDSIAMSVDHISFTKRTGMSVNKVTAATLTLTPSRIHLTDGYVDIDKSVIELNELTLGYKQWTMANFVNTVYVEADIKSSQLDFSTIEQFSRRRRHWDLGLSLSGTMKGMISDMKGHINHAKTLSTDISDVEFELKGLPDVQTTHFKVDIREIDTSPEDMNKIYQNFTQKNINAVENLLKRVNRVKIAGKFDGLFSKFGASGIFNTEYGALDMNLAIDPKNSGYDISGAVKTEAINLGGLFGIKKIGNFIFDAKVNGHVASDSLNLATKADIDLFEYNRYGYSKLTANGDLVNKTFTGFLGSVDENMDFKFNGLIDMNRDIPSYDFLLNIASANLNAINFNRRDSISLLSGEMSASGRGNDIDNLNADIHIGKLKYINHLDTVAVGEIDIATRNSRAQKLLKLDSDFADIEIKARHSFKNIFKYFSSTVKKYLPSLQEYDIASAWVESSDSLSLETSEELILENYYVASLNVKQANNVASIFTPGLHVAEGTRLSFLFNPLANSYSLAFNSHEISKEDTFLKDINIDSRNHTDSISIFARIGETYLGNIYIPNLSTIASIKNNNINLSSRFRNSSDGSAGFIQTQSVIRRDSSGIPQIDINIKPSYFTLGEKMWHTNNSHIIIDSTAINIDRLRIFSDSLSESLLLNGVMSRSVTDTISLTINDIALSGINSFIEHMGYNLSGSINGRAQYVKPNATLLSDIDINNLMINEYSLGESNIDSYTDGNIIKYNLRHSSDTIVSGEYYRDIKKYYMRGRLDSVNIALFSPFMKSIADNISGKGIVRATLDNDNPRNKPSINGNVTITDFGARMLFTNVKYSASAEVEVKDNQFTMTRGQISDPYGSSAPLYAWLTNKDFKNVIYNISASPSNMLCFNTTERDNDLFYGHMFATGSVDVIGHGTEVMMNVAAVSDNKSYFIMPLNDKTVIGAADFIKYVSADSSDQAISRKFISSGRGPRIRRTSFGINLNLDVRPNTEVKIIIDPAVGDALTARGNGNFAITAEPSEDIFTINGGYEITEGDYLFTLQNIINKRFIIQPGSTISWSGNPLNANLGVTATYQVKASLAPLLGSTSSYAGARVPVDCNLMLTGLLTKPDISLGITVPNADPETQSLISAALNTEEAVSMQIFWLLFGNTFYSDSSTSTSNVNVGIMSSAVTGIEFLSNQLSNWFSSDRFNFGINYMPKTDMTSDEVELSVSAPILNNKLYIDIDGNYNAKNNTTTDAMNSISGDFYLTWILDQSAKMKAKAFSRTITTFDENQGLQENGVGLYYKDSFNNFKELVKKYKVSYKMMRDNRKEKKEYKDSLIMESGKDGYKMYKKSEKQKERNARKEEREEGYL